MGHLQASGCQDWWADWPRKVTIYPVLWSCLSAPSELIAKTWIVDELGLMANASSWKPQWQHRYCQGCSISESYFLMLYLPENWKPSDTWTVAELTHPIYLSSQFGKALRNQNLCTCALLERMLLIVSWQQQEGFNGRSSRVLSLIYQPHMTLQVQQ